MEQSIFLSTHSPVVRMGRPHDDHASHSTRSRLSSNVQPPFGSEAPAISGQGTCAVGGCALYRPEQRPRTLQPGVTDAPDLISGTAGHCLSRRTVDRLRCSHGSPRVRCKPSRPSLHILFGSKHSYVRFRPSFCSRTRFDRKILHPAMADPRLDGSRIRTRKAACLYNRSSHDR